MLVTVLIVTAIGLLFGAGALMLFRFQCQMRIDRQHELEKVYAVRSVLGYVRTNMEEIPDEGIPFEYHTDSERDLRLIVKPVEPVFPVLTNAAHFVMQRGDFEKVPSTQRKFYPNGPDYEYGAVGVTDLMIGKVNVNAQGGQQRYGLAFTDLAATNSVVNGVTNCVKWWVNIGMRGTGGWLQEDYGRRYYFHPLEYVDGDSIKDTFRLCIIRNVTNESNAIGCRHGWPLSKPNERAFVFQISPRAGKINGNNAEMSLSEYWHNGESVMSSNLLVWANRPSDQVMGLQLAMDKVSIFYSIDKNGSASANENIFSEGISMSGAAYRYFAEQVRVGDHIYGGVTNIDGRVYAPELRAVIEVESSSDKRNRDGSLDPSNLDFVSDFKVTPAYQYDVFLEHPAGVTNRATVAQKIGQFSRSGGAYTVLTYDTHGTEHKGFRQDEREHERMKSGR